MSNPVVFSRRLSLALFAVAAFLISSPGHGQRPAEPRSEPTQAPRQSDAVGSVHETEPKVYHLFDKYGEPIVVPDFSFEKFEQLIRLERNLLPPPAPRYQFTDNILISGTAHENFVALEVTVPVRITAAKTPSKEPWVRIPLRLNQAIRAPRIQYEGPGEAPLATYTEVEGHIVWLRAGPGTDHTISLQAKVPLRRVGNESQLTLLAPLAGLRIALTIPETGLKASLGDAAPGMLTLQTAEKATALLLQSNGGEIHLSWRKEDKTPSVLESVGTITVQVDGGQLTCDAQLTVRSHGSPLESILIRLPPQMELISTDPGNSEMQLDTEGIGDDESESKVVRVHRKDGRETADFDVRLRAMRPHSQERAAAEPIQIAGFDVLGARIQSGHVDIEVRGDWDTEFITGDHVRPDAQFSDALRQRDVVARFKYTGQPFSLQVRVREKKSRVNVEPVYLVFLDANQAHLDATLTYRISGARAKILKLDMNGWQVDAVAPLELLSEPYSVDQAGHLIIPLATSSYPLPGEFELQIKAHQEISVDEPINFGLPRPLEENTPAAAALAILPADNIQLSLSSEEIQGLLNEPLPAEIELPTRQQLPLFFRETPSGEPPLFVANLLVRERTVTVSVKTLLRFTKRQIAVEQRLRYHIDYEPLSELRLEVPASLAENDTLHIEVNDQPLRLEVERLAGAEAETDVVVETLHEARLHLLEDQIGDCELKINYITSADYSSADNAATVVLPLIVPAKNAQTSLTQHALRLQTGEGLQVELLGDGWSRTSPDTVNGSLTEPTFELVDDKAEITAAVLVNRSPNQSATRLHRVWLQTWLTESVRRDRVVFQLTTNEEHVQLQLPPGVAADDVQVLVGGRSWNELTTRTAAAIEVQLENTGTAQDYTIELWYWFEARKAPLGRVAVGLPYVAGLDRAQRIFWQLVLPENEHLLWAPKGLTREYQWQRIEYHWGRQPNRGLRDLEQLLAASTQDSLPDGRNEYLFSTVGPLQSTEFHTTRRTTFVLPISGVILLAGLLLIYFPVLRHPAAVLIAGVSVLAVGCVFPEPTILAVQASLLGLILVLTARLLRWRLVGRRYRLAPAISGAAQAPDSNLSERSVTVQDGTSRLPTTVAPSPIRIPAGDPEP